MGSGGHRTRVSTPRSLHSVDRSDPRLDRTVLIGKSRRVSEQASFDQPIRVAMVQPALAAYRVPVFRELAARPGIDLTLWYDQVPELQNVAPDGFAGHFHQAKKLGPLRWDRAVLDACGGDFDVALLSWNANDLTLLPALRKARKHGVGTVLWGHGYSKYPKAWRSQLRDSIGRKADCVLLYDR